ncbi:MAG: hypothetical protein KGR47_15575 [Acidobacteria bacterium]|nr:hypothetical protein [Acidobacteriota bacterium]
MSDWWEVVEGALERLGDDAPDPWADAAVDDAPGLTPEQRAFLEQISDTPGLRFRPADDGDDAPDEAAHGS